MSINMGSSKSRGNPYGPGHPLHYLLALLGTITVATIEVSIPLFSSGLRTAPFALVPAIVALYGDYWPGIFTILLSSIAVDYTMAPMGIKFDSSALFRVLEFVVISSTIFTLAWRSRRLYASNISLKAATKILRGVVEDLKIEAHGNQKELEKLNNVNKRLVALVDKFVEDDEYWARRLTTPVAPTHKAIKRTAK